MFVVGGAMFSTAIQYIVVRSIISQPTKFTEKLVLENESTKDFKREKDVKALRRLLVQECLGNSAQTPAKAQSHTQDEPSSSSYKMIVTMMCPNNQPHTSQRQPRGPYLKIPMNHHKKLKKPLPPSVRNKKRARQINHHKKLKKPLPPTVRNQKRARPMNHHKKLKKPLPPSITNKKEQEIREVNEVQSDQ
jgi:hypothetical protein